jgi:hypothetical protein
MQPSKPIKPEPTMTTIKDLIAAQQGTPTFDAILKGNDWAQFIAEERSRRRHPEFFERIALQKAFIQSLDDSMIESLFEHTERLDWIASRIVKEQK